MIIYIGFLTGFIAEIFRNAKNLPQESPVLNLLILYPLHPFLISYLTIPFLTSPNSPKFLLTPIFLKDMICFVKSKFLSFKG